MKIVLLGYMGSGKSTVGKLLAEALEIPFLDLDDYIEKIEEQSIANIFAQKGEIYFRKKEAASLRKVLSRAEDLVLSIGGGTPCYANNMQAISEITNDVFYLKASISKLVNRLSKEKSERPLIKNFDDEELPEFIGKHLFERSFYYSQAEHNIQCDNMNPSEIVKEIKTLLS